jgi:hypothetical protein
MLTMNKSILLIMPNFFDYPQVISEELTNMGFNVDYFDDRPSTNGFVKAIIRYEKKIINRYIQRYFYDMLSLTKDKKYDVVFVISGQSLSFDEKMMEQLKTIQSQATFILYQWDSLKNFPYIKTLNHFFDQCYSFDKEDVKENEYLKFLPLFYSKRYEEMAHSSNEFTYDFCFVGTAHPQKYKFINMMREQLKEIYPKQFIYYFFPSRLVFVYRKLFNREFRKARYNEFHFEALSGKMMDDVYKKSKCVLDSAQKNQIGLTIRSIEALGAKKKLITTNKDIVNYDFYHEENIYVYEGSFDFDSVFFTKKYVNVDKEIYEKYSLRNWLKTMLEEKNEGFNNNAKENRI